MNPRTAGAGAGDGTGPAFVWRPDAERIDRANLTAFLRAAGVPDHDALLARADADPEWFWDALIRHLDIRFYRPWDRLLDLSGGIEFPRWCIGATTNVVLNALDRHGPEMDARPALIGVSELGDDRTWTYADLKRETARLAAGLADLGIGRGDVVGLLMPAIPEAAAAFFAIAKLGAIVLPIFSGFGPDGIASRLAEGGAVAVVTADGTSRRGRRVALKGTLDAALDQVPSVRHVVVLRRMDPAAPLVGPRDVDWAELVAGRPGDHPTAEVAAEHPLMIVFTSGSTGRPKGVVLTHAGYAVKSAQDWGLYLDLKPGDRMLRIVDFGFVGGASSIVPCGMLGATFVMFDAAPDFPGPDRLWRAAERHRATVIGVLPTMVRSLRRLDPDGGTGGVDLSSLRTIVSAGEPWDEESWLWTFEKVGRRRLPILNYSGGTEIGGIVMSHVLAPQKPCSFHGPAAGTGADIVDAEGRSLPPGERGELVMRMPCMGRTTMLWRNRERYLESYWRQIPGMWVQGDWASRDADGCWFLHGRSDDSIKVAARRVGPAEVESVLLATGLVADLAAVGVPDPVRGSAVACVVVPLGTPPADLEARLSDALVRGLGPSFRPALVMAVDELPRTRNGKVVRRAVRAALLGEETADRAGLLDEAPLAAIEAAARARRER